jgi:Ran GTPase-activating protein (RanGAP) involved in mRNA processing and transport
VIETLKHLLSGFAPFTGGEITEALLRRSTQWNAREETADEVVVTGREKVLERKPGSSFALLRPKGRGERLDPVEPQERRPDEISWPGLQAE